MNRNEELERRVVESLTDVEPEQPDPGELAVKLLPPKVVVRIRTEFDPIVEETKIVRKTAKEIDGRYDRYLERTEE
jgi:hypothetical protein